MATTTEKGNAFEQFVAEHYERLGYHVRRNVPFPGKQIDLVATLRLPDAGTHTVLLECKYKREGDSAGNDDVNSIIGAYHNAQRNNLAQGCTVVTTNSFSLDAQRAAETAGVHLLTQHDLIRLTKSVPLAYALPLQRVYHQALRLGCFIHGRASSLLQPALIDDLAGYLYEQSTNATPGVTLLHGGIGTGKTTQLLALAERLASECLGGMPVPLAIHVPLERFARRRRGQYLDDFIIDHLATQFGIRDISWNEIKQWLTNGIALLILDGLDEIPQLDTATAIAEELEHIGTILPTSSIAILSCRTTLAARLPTRLPDFITSELINSGHQIRAALEVLLFTHEDLIRYINTVGAPKKLLQGGITSSVLYRPLLLNTVIEVLKGRVPATAHLESASALLEYCVTYLLRHRTLLRHAGIELSEWRTFLEECALDMMLAETRHVTPQRLASMIAEHFVSTPDIAQLHRLQFDASVRTVLDFDLERGGLRWTHAIFRDFLASSAIARRLIVPGPQDRRLDGRPITTEQADFIRHAMQRRQREWRSVTEFRRPRPSPPPISPSNSWQWISPGLSLINDSTAGSRLVFFPRGYWITEQPITGEDLRTIGVTWITGDQHRYATLRPAAPVTSITHDEAERLAFTVGGRLPTDHEWERAAQWIDGSYPREDVLPAADPRRARPPYVTGVPGNPWGVRNAAGCVWQWTATYDAGTHRFVCRGEWWGASIDEKRNPSKRLLPKEPDHIRTGVRIVSDPTTGGEL